MNSKWGRSHILCQGHSKFKCIGNKNPGEECTALENCNTGINHSNWSRINISLHHHFYSGMLARSWNCLQGFNSEHALHTQSSPIKKYDAYFTFVNAVLYMIFFNIYIIYTVILLLMLSFIQHPVVHIHIFSVKMRLKCIPWSFQINILYSQLKHFKVKCW